MEKMERKDAITNGLRRYYTGEQCKRGHVSERWTLNGACIECQDETREIVAEKMAEARSKGAQ